MPLTEESALRKDQRAERVTFQHRHFATIADIINARLVHQPVADWTTREIANIFAQELSFTNPKFDRARFMRACGLED